MVYRAFIPVALAALAACTTFPELENEASTQALAAPFPTFLPSSDFDQVPSAAAPEIDAMEARIEALRARAALLRRPVLTDEDRARLF